MIHFICNALDCFAALRIVSLDATSSVLFHERIFAAIDQHPSLTRVTMLKCLFTEPNSFLLCQASRHQSTTTPKPKICISTAFMGGHLPESVELMQWEYLSQLDVEVHSLVIGHKAPVFWSAHVFKHLSFLRTDRQLSLDESGSVYNAEFLRRHPDIREMSITISPIQRRSHYWDSFPLYASVMSALPHHHASLIVFSRAPGQEQFLCSAIALTVNQRDNNLLLLSQTCSQLELMFLNVMQRSATLQDLAAGAVQQVSDLYESTTPDRSSSSTIQSSSIERCFQEGGFQRLAHLKIQWSIAIPADINVDSWQNNTEYITTSIKPTLRRVAATQPSLKRATLRVRFFSAANLAQWIVKYKTDFIFSVIRSPQGKIEVQQG